MKIFDRFISQLKKLNLKKNILSYLLILISSMVQSQNCSVNAGVNSSHCANSAISIVAFTSGPLAATSNILWTKLSGPSLTINNPTSLNTLLSGFARIGGVFTFEIGVNCALGGRAFDTVTITILATPNKPNAGNDTSFCAGTKNLNATAPSVGETGNWRLVSANWIGNNANSPSLSNSTITSFDFGHTNFLSWTLTNTSTSCSDADSISITFCGGDANVNAGPDRTIDNCYVSAPTSFRTGVANSLINAIPSNMGRFCNQSGTWSLVSKPATAPDPNYSSIFDNQNCQIGNLYPGIYRFAWTVSGNCASGSDTVQITVPNPIGVARPWASNTIVYLCGDSIAALQGPNLMPGQTFSGWTKTSGLPGDSIGSPASLNTTAFKLKMPTSGQSSNFYQYSYEVCAGACCERSFVTIYVERTPSLDIIPSIIDLPCNQSSAIIPFKFKNLGFGFQIFQTTLLINPIISYSLVDTINGNINLSNLQVGKYNFRIRSTQVGCASTITDDVEVNRYATPTLSNAGSNQRLQCGVDSSSLVGNIPLIGSGAWSQVSGPSSVSFLPNNLINVVKIKNLSVGAYRFRWSINSGTCPSNFNDVWVYVANVLPSNVSAGSNRSICFAAPIRLKGSSPKDNEFGTWTVSPSGPTFSNRNDSGSMLSGFSASTNYKLIWTITNACGSIRDSIDITTSATAGPNATSAGPNQCLSAGTTSINLSAAAASPVVAIGTWRKVGSFSGTISNPNSNTSTVTGMSNGHYRFSWTVAMTGCDSTSDTISVSIISAASVANAGKDTIICATVTNLNAITPTVGVGEWISVSGPTIPAINNKFSNTATLSNLVPGTYVMQWLIKNGVCPATSANISILVQAPASVAVAMADTTLCNNSHNGNAIALRANRPSSGNGKWSAKSGPQAINVFPDTAIITNSFFMSFSGTYVFNWQVSSGSSCPIYIDTVNIHHVTLSNAGADIKLCNKNSQALIGNFGSNGTWTQIGTSPNIAVLSKVNGWTATATNLITGAYTFEYVISAGSCTRKDTMKLEVFSPISPFSLGNDTTFCLRDTNNIFLKGAAKPAGIKAKWSLLSRPFGYNVSFRNNIDSIPNAVLTNTNLKGEYLLRYTLDNGGCIEQSIIKYTINDGFIANAGPDIGRCSGNDTFIFNGMQKLNGKYNWSRMAGLGSLPFSPDSFATKVTITTAQNYGDYLYKVRDTVSGCIFEDTLKAANSITPYGYATPSIQNICGNRTINPINFRDSANLALVIYSWTRNNTVNVTGMPNNGSGNTISNYLLSNTTNAIQTVIITINCISRPPSNCIGNIFYDTIIVKPNPDKILKFVFDEKTYCLGDTLTLKWANLPPLNDYCISTEYDCLGDIIYQGTDTTLAILLNSSNGKGVQYYITALDTNGCEHDDNMFIYIEPPTDNPKLDVKYYGNCYRDSMYVYDGNSGNGINFTFSSKFNGEGKIYSTGKYYSFIYIPDTFDGIDPVYRRIYVKVNYGKGCPAFDSIDVEIFPNTNYMW